MANKAVQIVADSNGDTRIEFAVDNEAEVAAAMERFNDLVKNRKKLAFAAGEDGKPATQLKAFDPTVKTTIFMPQYQGG